MKDIIVNINKLLWYTLPINSEEGLFSCFDLSNSNSFDKQKLEKDFYLTAILAWIAKEIPEINFKWWTCLNKIYFPYFRLSEDLDFSISIENNLVDSNKKRELFAQKVRSKIKEICKIMNWKLNPDAEHHAKAQWNKYLKTLQYTYLKYEITYPSIYTDIQQTIKVEISYTNKQYLATQNRDIQSIFLDPVTEDEIFQSQSINCLSLQEMMAEKMRAALTRQYPAIRDFFDIRYVKSQGFDFGTIRSLIDNKVDESDTWYTLQDSYADLKTQIPDKLNPVLWKNISSFDFDEIYKFILTFKK